MIGKKKGGKNYARTSTGRKIRMSEVSNNSGGIRIEMGRHGMKPKRKPLIDMILDPIENNLGRFAVKNLMLYIVGGMALVYLADLFVSANKDLGFSLLQMLSFDSSLILKGQVWRIFTFIFVPEFTSIFYIIFELYLCWMIGTALEREWGSFRFDAYYLTGVIGCIIAGFICGASSVSYLNMSLFIAYALFFPNAEFLMFFFLPIKAKWIAVVDALLIMYMLLISPLRLKIVILFSLLNLFLFFGKDIYTELRMFIKRSRRSHRR